MSLTIPSNIMQSLLYTDGMFLTSANMTAEQAYFNNWIYLQNQCTFTPGVFAGGMQVTQQGNSLIVSSGVGIDGAGHLLVVATNGTPVAMPATLTNPFYVYAQYPAIGTPIATGSPILSYTAQVMIGNSVPSGAVQLATGVASGTTISSVTNNSQPVLLQPTMLNSSLMSMANVLRGSATVDTSKLTNPGTSTSETVVFPTTGTKFTSAPMVTVTVQGSIPYALAVASDTTQFVVTLAAVQSAQASDSNTDSTNSSNTSSSTASSSVVLNWLAFPNP
ncbi:MAG: hypothetical protein WA071_27015 [Undibacterium umbellatum]|uniref:hypothetical protein n=1 Tax=Undibacterium umbellatum TaxID=2762300 RepID=UPI003BB6C91F